MAGTREEAWELLKEYNQEPFHRQHGLTVEGCMRYFARELGYGDEEDFWGLVGLLHDLDYEKYPDQHCRKEAEILREKGWDEKLIHAVASHGWPRCSDVEPQLEMEKVLYAAERADWSDRCLRHHAAQQERAESGSKKPEKEVQEQKVCRRVLP